MSVSLRRVSLRRVALVTLLLMGIGAALAGFLAATTRLWFGARRLARQTSGA